MYEQAQFTTLSIIMHFLMESTFSIFWKPVSCHNRLDAPVTSSFCHAVVPFLKSLKNASLDSRFFVSVFAHDLVFVFLERCVSVFAIDLALVFLESCLSLFAIDLAFVFLESFVSVLGIFISWKLCVCICTWLGICISWKVLSVFAIYLALVFLESCLSLFAIDLAFVFLESCVSVFALDLVFVFLERCAQLSSHVIWKMQWSARDGGRFEALSMDPWRRPPLCRTLVLH